MCWVEASLWLNEYVLQARSALKLAFFRSSSFSFCWCLSQIKAKMSQYYHTPISQKNEPLNFHKVPLAT